MEGLIVKGIGGFYYFLTSSGIIEAKGRGIFKKDGFVLAVGDLVELERLEDGTGVITHVMPRKNQFIRPPIANVDLFIIVFSPRHPKPNYMLIDKFLIMAETHGVESLLCVNKCDLASEKEREEIAKIYQDIYPVFFVSCKTGEGLTDLKKQLRGKKAALAGPSGVGKSTILNSFHPKANMETGEISCKTNRGKHTTRHAEIFPVEEEGFLFDTPGFTSFEILEAEEDELGEFYPEIARLRGMCRYDDCRHKKEPGCAVREAAARGEIHPKRYESYLTNLEEIQRRKKY